MNAPKNLVTQLCEHLDEESMLHRRLLTLAEAKQRTIIDNDIPALTNQLAQEAEPVAQAARLRQVRERLVRNLAERLNLPAGEVRLSRLIETLPEPSRGQLAARRNEVMALIQALRHCNDANVMLLRHSLGLVRELLRMAIGDGVTKTVGYNRLGGNDDAATRGNLINATG